LLEMCSRPCKSLNVVRAQSVGARLCGIGGNLSFGIVRLPFCLQPRHCTEMCWGDMLRCGVFNQKMRCRCRLRTSIDI